MSLYLEDEARNRKAILFMDVPRGRRVVRKTLEQYAVLDMSLAIELRLGFWLCIFLANRFRFLQSRACRFI